MNLGSRYANSVFVDYLQQRNDEASVDENGKGVFRVNAGSVSIWVKKEM